MKKQKYAIFLESAGIEVPASIVNAARIDEIMEDLFIYSLTPKM